MFQLRKTEETISKTFRYPISLIDKMSAIAQNEGISLNSFVVQCCEYAIEHLDLNDNADTPKTDE